MAAFYPAYKERDFLSLPIRDVFRLANEMCRLKAEKELMYASAAMAGFNGGKEYFEDLQRRALGKKRFENSVKKKQDHQREKHKDKVLINLFHGILSNREARIKNNQGKIKGK